jgi:hypothetical protein
MLTEYSKPPLDVAAHTARLIADNDELLNRQRKIALALRGQPRRSRCILCGSSLTSAQPFSHRGVPYVSCDGCGHIQCAAEAPLKYPYGEQDFADIYRPLSPAAYRDRTERIYVPKLEWAIRAAKAVGLGDLSTRSWLDIGSGAGNFVDALRRAGARQAGGLEAEATLVLQANAASEKPLVRQFAGSLAQAVRENAADIYVAWFVLEHCFDTMEFLDALRERPAGTVFVFSVPTFGLATLLETAFDDHYARSLDSVLHLQLFTDSSIKYAMDRAGFEIRAEWIFGQDADDFYRALVTRVRTLGIPLADEVERLAAALPDIQQAFDRARLSDSRHILAVKK